MSYFAKIVNIAKSAFLQIDAFLYDVFNASAWDRLTAEQQKDAVFKIGVGR